MTETRSIDMSFTLGSDTRGFSDVMGYFLVFSIVIVTIGTVYSTGIGQMYEVQYSYRAANAQTPMEIVAHNAADIYQQGAPQRATQMHLRQTGLYVTGHSELNISVSNQNTGTSHTYTTSSRLYQYRTSRKLLLRIPKTTYTYEYGAVIRTDNAHSAMKTQPPFRFTPNHVQLSTVKLTGHGGVGGSGTAETVLTNDGNRLLDYTSSSARNIQVTVNLKTSPNRAGAWKRYFKSQGLTDTGQTDVNRGVVSYSYTTHRVLLHQSVINGEVHQ